MFTIIVVPTVVVCSALIVKVILDIDYYNTPVENHQVNAAILLHLFVRESLANS